MSWIIDAFRYGDLGLKIAFLAFLFSILCACGVVYGHFHGWWIP